MALDTTPGAASADSYASLTELATYLANRYPSTTLAAADSTNQEGAMRAGARLLDLGFAWTGFAVDDVQALAWPRRGMVTMNGFPIPTSGATSIPVQLKDAQMEFAVALYKGDRLSDNPSLKIIGSETSVQSIKAGPLALSFGGGTFSSMESFDAFVRSMNSDLKYLSKLVPDAVRYLLVPSWFKQPSIARPLIFGAM
jgi:hypothetical protein